MNVLISTSSLNVINGYTLVPRSLAIEFKKAGHKVKIITTEPPQARFPGESAEDFIKIGLLDLLLPFRIGRKLDSFHPDFVHTNGFTLGDFLVYGYAYRRHILTIATVHTRYRELIREVVPLGKYWPENSILKIQSILINALKQLDLVLALSSDMYEYLKSQGLERVEVVSNGVDLHKFQIADRKGPQTDPQLLYVGNIEKRKNQMFLLRMAKFLPENYTLHLIGGPSWDKVYYSSFLLYLKTHPTPQINYHGAISPGAVNRLYSACDLFVSASLMEAQSLVQIEALASGLPTVRLYSENTAGITQDRFTAIHLNEDATPEQFAKTVVQVISDHQLYRELRENCINVRKQYSWELSARHIIQIVQGLHQSA